MAKDVFAQIALDNQQGKKENLQEVKPIDFKTEYFEKTDEKTDYIGKKSYQEHFKQFEQDLHLLKEKMRTFMKDYTSEPECVRRKWEQEQFQFRFETDSDKSDFSRVIAGEGDWEQVSIPDYRGPVGRWTAFYRREFNFIEEIKSDKRYFLHFKGVDYIANIYLNERHLGHHEGFFAPFDVDVTDYLKQGQNILIVEVKNDANTQGIASWDDREIDGEKIYAATGPGWDDPQLGWHHCPPGAGIYNSVVLEERSHLYINSIFVRPDIDNDNVEAWVEVNNTEFNNQEFDLKLDIYPRNFKGKAIENIECEVEPAGPGVNYYRFQIPFAQYRLWSPQEPWLYKLRATIWKNEEIYDQQDSQFGMRKFHMEEEAQTGEDSGIEKEKSTEELLERRKGTLYLNNNPVILRGANTMGHLQQCVMQDDYEQLIEDILIARLAHMNYFRVTQRPVQEEIYKYCDMLGMMNQTDLPLFGFHRRSQFAEGVKQAGEMERLIRSHPSAVMVSYINEPFSVREKKRGHRDLYRNELEDFFESCTKAVKLANPDRVIKHVEGDYNPPTRTGLSDFHCYNIWYTNHALPIGKMHKGYLPAIRKGWKAGCGEYGTEGLDPKSVMLEDYPQEWIPDNIDDRWSPQDIIKAQTYSMHGDWFEEQYYLKDWIEESQKHQALATGLMTDAFRRRSDVIVSTAIHLLIDAWPAGWMKALVDHRRKPKPAFFAYQRVLEPVRVNLRSDRLTAYTGEKLEVESWILNDTADNLGNHKVIVTLRKENQDLHSYKMNVEAGAVSPTYTGTIQFEVPEVTDREFVYLDAALINQNGEVINKERLTIEAFTHTDSLTGCIVIVAGDREKVNDIIKDKGVNIKSLSDGFGGNQSPGIIIINSIVAYQKNADIIKNWVASGNKAVFLLNDIGEQTLNINGNKFSVENMNGLTFIARNKKQKLTEDFMEKDFSFWYDKNKDYIGFAAKKYINCENQGVITPLLFTYQKPEFGEQIKGKKNKLPVAGKIEYGQGQFILLTLSLDGFTGVNPVCDRFLANIIE